MSTVACPVKNNHLGLGAHLLDLGEHVDPRQSGHLQIEQRRIVQSPLEGLERGRPVGTDGHLVTHARQLHLHEITEVSLIVGK